MPPSTPGSATRRPDDLRGAGAGVDRDIQVRRRVVRNPKVLAGIAILAAFCLSGGGRSVLQATVWSSQPSVYRPEAGHDPSISHPSGPALAHPLGTDALGRDVLSLLTFSLAPTSLVALVVAVTVGVCSVLAGSAAAYFRGKTDGVPSNLAYGLMLLPPPLILLSSGWAVPTSHRRTGADLRAALRAGRLHDRGSISGADRDGQAIRGRRPGGGG